MLKSQAPPGVLSGRALVGLRLYQYKAGGTTWLDDAHNPVWEALVRRLPMWLAPNLITLIGTLCIVTAYLLNITYNPGFTGEAPWWVYLVTCVSVALYVNLDCMDGKQARRTGSSSPLGQLFDHGCDALALHMMLANIAASLGVGCGWKMAAGCLGIMVPWMMAQWEEYHTGIMMYGNAFYGVLEANYSICAVHLVSAASGLQLWRTEVPLPRPLAFLLGALSSSSLATLGPNLLGLATGAAQDRLLQAASGLEQLKVASGHEAAAGAPAGALYVREGGEEVPLVQTATVAEIALVVVSLAGILQGVSNVQRVFSAGPLPEKEAGHKPLGRGWAFLHLLGLLFVTLTGATSVALAGQPHNDTLLTDHTPLIQSLPRWLQGMFTQLLQSPSAECRMAFSMFGLTYALTASQLIVAHMAKEPWVPSVIALLCPLLYVVSRVAGGGAGWPQPVLVLAGLHVLAAVVYFRYVVAVTGQVCAYLGIKCLSITPAKQTAAGKSN